MKKFSYALKLINLDGYLYVALEGATINEYNKRVVINIKLLLKNKE